MPFLSHILKKNAQDSPDKICLVCSDRKYSYRQIDELSDNMAACLKSRGINKNDKIGIFTNKDIEEVIAIFAIVKAGAVFVHINPQYKEAHLNHLIHDCSIKTVFTDKFKSDILNNAFCDNCPLETIIATQPDVTIAASFKGEILEFHKLEKNKTGFKDDDIKDDDLASIIYTSGSTGMPKGIMVTHKIFEDATRRSAEVLENNPDDRLISVTPFSFDGALSQLFTAFYAGGALVQQKSVFPKDIVKTLIDEKITGFHAMPSLWNILLQKHSSFEKYRYPHLRYVSIIGEHFPPSQLARLKEILKSTKFYMMYGTTEAFRSTYLPPKDFDRKPSSVGIPFKGVEISIVDENGKNCPTGEVGEIVHTGAFVSPGYWNNERGSAEIFKNGTLYTGDLGKLDDEGYLYFVSRKDSMIKSSGFRVSPYEIERCLVEMEGVKEVAVVGIYDDQTGTRIKAVVVCQNDISLSEKDVIGYCRKNLPFYMVPNIVDFRTSLPKTASGKISKSNLTN